MPELKAVESQLKMTDSSNKTLDSVIGDMNTVVDLSKKVTKQTNSTVEIAKKPEEPKPA